MISIKNFSPRLYQTNIVKTCIEKNCLVVLPTGTGKTAIAILLAVERLNKFPESKILFCSPTRPLCSQHRETFLSATTLKESDILLYTGMVKSNIRSSLFKNSIVIIATPQTITSDISTDKINLENFSLLVIDEAHRSRMKYATTLVAKHYIESAKNPRILALTASPGSTKEKIKEICDNLFIEDVEIRTETDYDVKPHMQEKSISYIEIALENEFIKIRDLFKSLYKEKLKDINKIGFNKPIYLVNKRDLIALQKQLQLGLSKKNPSTFFGLSLVARLLKLSYMIELIETQSLNPLQKFLNKLESENTKAAKALMKSAEIVEAKSLVENLVENNVLHPKMKTLSSIIKEQLELTPESKIIIFANYRDTIEEIIETIKSIPGCKPIKLIGHKEGITQKQQMETISRFELNEFNCIITTSIGEEGISIGALDIAIFYDNVPSAIRRIQREGRVARIKPGRIIYLTVKNSIDSAYHWKSRRDERLMKSTIKSIKTKLEDQQRLTKYSKDESNS